MRTIAVMNNKGGVGKTAATINLADILSREKKKRCTIFDIDGQRNLTRFFFPDLDLNQAVTTRDLLLGNGEAVWSDNLQMVSDTLGVVPGTPLLYDLDVAAIMRDEHCPIHKRAFLDFKRAMEDDGTEDFLLFDCPPGFTSASCAALVAADEVIIPMVIDGFNFDGIADMRTQVQNMRTVNRGIQISGVLINQWHRSDLVVQGEALLRSLDVHTFETVVRRTEKMPESTVAKTPIRLYSPGSSASRDFKAWVDELLGEV